MELEDKNEVRTLEESEKHIMTQEKFNAGCRALSDNGIDPDESAIVLQALCYILLDEETEQFMDSDIIFCQECQSFDECLEGNYPTVWDERKCFIKKEDIKDEH